MTDPLFSVIIPAYNSEKYITRGLQSIRNQSFQDFQLIVVCDSCYDNTESIAKDYGAETATVSYGCDGLTRDHGMRMATGQWILFMDDDDWYLHEYCFKQLSEVIGKHDEDVLAFSYIWKGKGYIRHTKENVLDTESHVWAKCWRRAAIRNAYFGNARFASDTYFIKRMRKNINRAVIWDMPIYYYNFMREGSQTELLCLGAIRAPLAAK